MFNIILETCHERIKRLKGMTSTLLITFILDEAESGQRVIMYILPKKNFYIHSIYNVFNYI